MSDGNNSSSSKFSWLSLAGLERLAAIQAGLTDEELEALDSASTAAQKVVVARAASAEPGLSNIAMTRDDSNESQESSIGDLPIELPHLAEEDELFNLAASALAASTSARRPPVVARGRSKSLDGDQDKNAQMTFSRGPPLISAGRAVTVDLGNVFQISGHFSFSKSVHSPQMSAL